MDFSKIFQKAGNVRTGTGLGVDFNNNTMFQLITGESVKTVYSSKELINLNKNWVSICNNKNAQTIASIPIKLYYLKPYNKTISRNSFKSINHNKQVELSKKLSIDIKAGNEIIEITEHPLINLLAKINNKMNYSDFVEIIQSYLGLIGNAYVKINFDNEGIPESLEPLLSENVIVYANHTKDGQITKYEYINDDTKIYYKPEEIIHFVNYKAGNCILGRGELEECIDAVQLYNFMDAYEAYLSKNNGRPDFAIAYENKLSEKDYKEVYKQWIKRFTGAKNSGKPVVTTGGEYEIKNLGFSPKDLSYQQGRRWCRESIAAAYNIPLSLLTSESINLANAVEGNNTYYRFNIYPRMVKLCAKLNEQLLNHYEQEGLFLYFEESYTSSDNEKASNAVQLLSAGIIDKNEARSMCGFEAVEEGEDNNEE